MPGSHCALPGPGRSDGDFLGLTCKERNDARTKVLGERALEHEHFKNFDHPVQRAPARVCSGLLPDRVESMASQNPVARS